MSAPPWADGPEFTREAQEKALVVTLRLRNPITAGEGTAVRVGRKGPITYYLTADHCVKDPSVLLDVFTAKSFPDADSTVADVKVEERWPQLDLALLKSLGEPTKPLAAICPGSKLPEVGTKGLAVLTVGCTDGDAPLVQIERIGPMRKIHKGRQPGAGIPSWETDRPSVEGRSGGPMFSPDGFLIGIGNGTDGKHGYYLHVDEIRKVLSRKDLKHIIGDEAPAKSADPTKKPPKSHFALPLVAGSL